MRKWNRVVDATKMVGVETARVQTMPEFPSSSLGHYSNYSAVAIAQPPAPPSHPDGATTRPPTSSQINALVSATPAQPTNSPTIEQAPRLPSTVTDLPPLGQLAAAVVVPPQPGDEETQSEIGKPEHPVPKLPDFSWGNHDSATIVPALSSAYCKVVHWRRNNFPVPFGSVEKSLTLGAHAQRGLG